MIYCLAACVSQIQQLQALQPPILRTFKKKETERYAVVVDSEGPAGTAHYEFELKLFAQNSVAGTPDTMVSATFLNLKSTFGEMRPPVRKAFGSALYEFGTTGLPGDFSLVGENSALVTPILCWYLPVKAPLATGAFEVPDMVFDKSIHVSGSGTYQHDKGSIATIKLSLGFLFEGRQKPASEEPPSFDSTATFNAKTGLLLQAEGEMRGLGGVLTFHLRKL